MSGQLEQSVSHHYGRGGLAERIFAALEAAGADLDALTVDDLAPVDEFHTAGRVATLKALAMTPLEADMHVLDAGSGIGGTARRIATDHGCRVTGVDLTPEFTEVARLLTEKTRLSGECTFETASVLATPFADATFDAAVTMHVAMNVEDRASFYAELARVLKPGAPLCVFDVMKGPTAGMTYPVPWAESEATSFLKSAAETRALLEQAGFDVTDENNLRLFAIDFFHEAASRAEAAGAPPLGLHVLMGPSAQEKLANYLRAVEMRQIEPVILIARRQIV
jgi:ubiquinone/menaquinone biosynthesis C-methylase UbiE